MTPARLGITVGALLSAVAYFVYIAVLHEPGSLFYGFAALVFLACPLIAGIIAISKTRNFKPRRFFACSGLVFGFTLLLFIVTYAVLPQFDRSNVQLPATCDGFDGVLDPPSQLAYTLPGGEDGILISESAESVLAVTIDGDRVPFASTAYLVRKSDNEILGQMRFNNDVVIASFDMGTVYIYNDKLGYLVDERTGNFEENILLIDRGGWEQVKIAGHKLMFKNAQAAKDAGDTNPNPSFPGTMTATGYEVDDTIKPYGQNIWTAGGP